MKDRPTSGGRETCARERGEATCVRYVSRSMPPGVAMEQLAVDLHQAGEPACRLASRRALMSATSLLSGSVGPPLAHTFDHRERKTSTSLTRRWRQPRLFLPGGVFGKDLGSSSAFLPSSRCSSSTGFCKARSSDPRHRPVGRCPRRHRIRSVVRGL
jgi:hypothetical protein